MREAVIVDAVRTPLGRGKETGSLHGWHPVDLAAEALRALVDRTKIDPAEVERLLFADLPHGRAVQPLPPWVTPERFATRANGEIAMAVVGAASRVRIDLDGFSGAHVLDCAVDPDFGIEDIEPALVLHRNDEARDLRLELAEPARALLADLFRALDLRAAPERVARFL